MKNKTVKSPVIVLAKLISLDFFLSNFHFLKSATSKKHVSKFTAIVRDDIRAMGDAYFLRLIELFLWTRVNRNESLHFHGRSHALCLNRQINFL